MALEEAILSRPSNLISEELELRGTLTVFSREITSPAFKRSLLVPGAIPLVKSPSPQISVVLWVGLLISLS